MSFNRDYRNNYGQNKQNNPDNEREENQFNQNRDEVIQRFQMKSNSNQFQSVPRYNQNNFQQNGLSAEDKNQFKKAMDTLSLKLDFKINVQDYIYGLLQVIQLGELKETKCAKIVDQCLSEVEQGIQNDIGFYLLKLSEIFYAIYDLTGMNEVEVNSSQLNYIVSKYNNKLFAMQNKGGQQGTPKLYELGYWCIYKSYYSQQQRGIQMFPKSLKSLINENQKEFYKNPVVVLCEVAEFEIVFDIAKCCFKQIVAQLILYQINKMQDPRLDNRTKTDSYKFLAELGTINMLNSVESTINQIKTIFKDPLIPISEFIVRDEDYEEYALQVNFDDTADTEALWRECQVLAQQLIVDVKSLQTDLVIKEFYNLVQKLRIYFDSCCYQFSKSKVYKVNYELFDKLHQYSQHTDYFQLTLRDFYLFGQCIGQVQQESSFNDFDQLYSYLLKLLMHSSYTSEPTLVNINELSYENGFQMMKLGWKNFQKERKVILYIQTNNESGDKITTESQRIQNTVNYLIEDRQDGKEEICARMQDILQINGNNINFFTEDNTISLKNDIHELGQKFVDRCCSNQHFFNKKFESIDILVQWGVENIKQLIPKVTTKEFIAKHMSFLFAAACVFICIESMPPQMRGEAKVYYNIDRLKKLVKTILTKRMVKYQISSQSQDVNSEIYTQILDDINRVLQNELQVHLLKESMMNMIYNDENELLNIKLNESVRDTWEITNHQVSHIFYKIIDERNKEVQRVQKKQQRSIAFRQSQEQACSLDGHREGHKRQRRDSDELNLDSIKTEQQSILAVAKESLAVDRQQQSVAAELLKNDQFMRAVLESIAEKQGIQLPPIGTKPVQVADPSTIVKPVAPNQQVVSNQGNANSIPNASGQINSSSGSSQQAP